MKLLNRSIKKYKLTKSLWDQFASNLCPNLLKICCNKIEDCTSGARASEAVLSCSNHARCTYNCNRKLSFVSLRSNLKWIMISSDFHFNSSIFKTIFFSFVLPDMFLKTNQFEKIKNKKFFLWSANFIICQKLISVPQLIIFFLPFQKCRKLKSSKSLNVFHFEKHRQK